PGSCSPTLCAMRILLDRADLATSIVKHRRPPPRRRRCTARREDHLGRPSQARHRERPSTVAAMGVPVLDHDAVLAAVSPTRAIAEVRAALVRYQRAEWIMPPKTYLPSPPYGDFR